MPSDTDYWDPKTGIVIQPSEWKFSSNDQYLMSNNFLFYLGLLLLFCYLLLNNKFNILQLLLVLYLYHLIMQNKLYKKVELLEDQRH